MGSGALQLIEATRLLAGNNLKTLETLSPNKMHIDSDMSNPQMSEVENLQVLSARKYQPAITTPEENENRYNIIIMESIPEVTNRRISFLNLLPSFRAKII